MRSLLILTIVALTFVASTSTVEARKYWETEASYEASATELRLPSRGTGIVRLAPCPGCKKLQLKLTSETRAFVRDQPVSLSQFRNLAIGNPAPVYVFYLPGSFEITRLVLDIHGY